MREDARDVVQTSFEKCGVTGKILTRPRASLSLHRCLPPDDRPYPEGSGVQLKEEFGEELKVQTRQPGNLEESAGRRPGRLRKPSDRWYC